MSVIFYAVQIVIDPRNLQIVHNPCNQTCKLWIAQHASILDHSPLHTDLLPGLLRQTYWPCSHVARVLNFKMQMGSVLVMMCVQCQADLVSHHVGNCRWNFLQFLVKSCAFDLVHTYKTFLSSTREFVSVHSTRWPQTWDQALEVKMMKLFIRGCTWIEEEGKIKSSLYRKETRENRTCTWFPLYLSLDQEQKIDKNTRNELLIPLAAEEHISF